MFAALVLDDPSRLSSVNREAFVNDLLDPTVQHVISIVRQWIETGSGQPTAAQVIARVSEDVAASLGSDLVSLTESVPERQQAWVECIGRLRRSTLERESDALKIQLKLAQAQGQSDVTQLLHEIHEKQRLINEEKTHGLHEAQAAR